MQILPVIHHLDNDTSFDQAHMAYEAGADGVFLISHNGKNHELPQLVRDIKAHMPLSVGVNFLGWDNIFAFSAAWGASADMLWLDAPGVRGHGLTSEGLQFAEFASRLPRERLQIFASVAFKYQPHEDYPAGAAHVAAANGFVPTTSGPATGEPPTLDKIRAMHAPGKALAIASGMTPDNIAEFAPYLSHVLVATGVSSDEHHFDFELLRTFIARARAQKGQ